MTARDRLWISLRHMKSGVVGVLLVIVATAIGIALAASTSAFIRAYREQTRQLLSNPAYREVAVDVLLFGEAELTMPVAEVELENARGGLLTVDHMMAAAQAIPTVDYAYVLQRAKVATTAALMRFEAEEKGRDDRGADRSRGETESAEAETPTEESKAAYEDKDIDRVGPEGTSSDATEAEERAAAEERERTERAMRGALTVMRDADKLTDEQVEDLFNIVFLEEIDPEKSTEQRQMTFGMYFRELIGSEQVERFDEDVQKVYELGDAEIVRQGGGTEQGQAEDQAREVQTEAADNRRAPQLDRTVITELPVDGFPGYATSTDFFTAYGLRAAEGTLFTQEDLDAGNLVMVLGSELAETLFPEDGAVGSQVSLWYQTVTIVGVLEPTSLVDDVDLLPYSAAAYTPMSTLAKAWDERAFVTNLRFATSDSSEAEAATAQVAAYFETAHPDTNVTVTSRIGQLRDERRTLSRTLVVLVFLTAVGLAIAAINLLNLMLIRVVRRTKNIGIMRSVGWSRRDVFRLFMTESVLMCVAGAAIGVVVSPTIYQLLRTTIISGEGFASPTFVLDLFAGAAVGLVFSLAFGLYPAYLAKDTDASAAVRTE